MRKTFLILALLLVGLFAFTGVASAYTPPEQYIHDGSKEVFETLCANPQYSYRSDVWYAWEGNIKFLFRSFESDQPFSLDLTDTAVPDGQSGGYNRYRPGQIRIIADEGQQVIVSSYSNARSSTYYNGQTVSLGDSSYYYEQQYYIDNKGVNDFPPGVYLNENPGNEVPWLDNLTLAPGKSVKFLNNTDGYLKVIAGGKVDAVKYAESNYPVTMVYDNTFLDKQVGQNQYVVLTNTDTGNITVNYSNSLTVTKDYNKPALNQYGLALPVGKSIRINSHSQSDVVTYKVISPNVSFCSYTSGHYTEISGNYQGYRAGVSTGEIIVIGYDNGYAVFTNEGNSPAEIWIPGEYEAITDYSKPALNQYGLALPIGKSIRINSHSKNSKETYKVISPNISFCSYTSGHYTEISGNYQGYRAGVSTGEIIVIGYDNGYAVFTNEGNSPAEIWIPGEYEYITDYSKPALNQYGLALPIGKSIRINSHSKAHTETYKVISPNISFCSYTSGHYTEISGNYQGYRAGVSTGEIIVIGYDNGYAVFTNEGNSPAEIWIPGEYEYITDYSKPALNQYGLALPIGKSIRINSHSKAHTETYKVISPNVSFCSYASGHYTEISGNYQGYRAGVSTGEIIVIGYDNGYAVFTNEGNSPAEIWIPGEYEAITDYSKPALLISTSHPTRYNCLINNSQAYAPDADYVIYTAANEIRTSGTTTGAILNINTGEYIVITPKSLPQTVFAPGEQFTMQEKGYMNINIPPIMNRDLSNGQPGAVNIDIPGGGTGYGSNPPEKYMHSSSKSNWQYLDNNPMYTYRYDFWYPWEGNAEFLFMSIESNSSFTIDFTNAGVELGTSGGYKYYQSGSVVVSGSPNQQIWYTDYGSRRSNYTLNGSGTRSFSLSGSGSWYEQQYYIDKRGVTDYIPQIYKFDKNGTPPPPPPGPGETNITIPAPTPKEFTPDQTGNQNIIIPGAGNRELINGQPGNFKINAPVIIDRPLIHGQPGSVNFTVTGSGGRTFDQGTPGAQNITIPEAQQRELNHNQGGTVNIVIQNNN